MPMIARVMSTSAKVNATLAGAWVVVQASLPAAFEVITSSGQVYSITSADLPMEERYSKGVQLIPAMLGDTVAQVRML